ncbi:hypothetical protein LSH36_687g01017 [Paralvinella palmiformis]|uniref:Hexosyltransferase n=1 Tax=Paralvinella palmiformis TaxID=53620 RepID=A0AAD9J3I9_9ANNE|nr:hypothetical protein LSH36_687g01017 [Paralvinella palmiformis]
MFLSRMWRLLPGKHLVITFTVMNVILMLLYKRMAQVYKLDVTIAGLEQSGSDPASFGQLDERGRFLRDVDGTMNGSELANGSDSASTVSVDGTAANGETYVVGDFISEPNINCRVNKLVIVYVYSERDHLEKRQLIRDTWGNLSQYDDFSQYELRLFFVTGRKDGDTDLMDDLKVEVSTFNDLLVGDFNDSPENLTLKGLNALFWIRANCPLNRIRFVFKTDDDVFVNLYAILNYVTSIGEGSRWHFLCLVNKVRSPKGSVEDNNTPKTTAIPEETYSTHCSGAGYGMSTHGLRLVLASCFAAPLIPEENIFFSSRCIRRVFPETTIRYRPLRRSLCLVDSKALKADLSTVRLRDIAKLILVHQLAPQYWPDVYDVVRRLRIKVRSKGAIT